MYNAIRKLRPILVGEILKKVLGIKRSYFKLANNTVFWIDPVSNLGLFLLNQGEYEPEMEQAIRARLKAGETFVDVGANEGYFSILAAQIVGNQGAVFSLEPQSRLEQVIQNNASANGLQSIVKVHRLGLSDQAGQRELFLTADINTGASSFTKHWKVGSKTERIRTITLDALIEELKIEKIDLLKIDCEGAEVQVIAGAEASLRTGKIKQMVVEFHPNIIGSKACEELHEKILSMNYKPQPNSGEFRIYIK